MSSRSVASRRNDIFTFDKANMAQRLAGEKLSSFVDSSSGLKSRNDASL
jgi:hypothetical protein